MKRFLLLMFLFFPLLLCGCSKNQPLLFFYHQPVTKENFQNPDRNFRFGERIYFLLYTPKGFKNDYLRVQLVKKEEKTEHWGYKIYQSKDYKIDVSKKYFSDYFVPGEKGYYFVQIFSFDDFDRPLARNDFWVK